MDRAIHNKITFFTRGIKAASARVRLFSPGSQTLSADPKSEFPRWR